MCPGHLRTSLYGKKNYRVRRALSGPAGAKGGPVKLAKSENSLGTINHKDGSGLLKVLKVVKDHLKNGVQSEG